MYQRLLIKLSGEALFRPQTDPSSKNFFLDTVKSIKELVDQGIQIALVVGGGNIFRGNQASALGMDRISADQIGMIATLINGLMLKQAFEALSCDARVLSAFPCSDFVEPYHYRQAIQYLEKGSIVIFVGGTGLPLFSTDTASALRSIEIKADILLKATKVDGVYDKDPKKFSDAVRFPRMTYSQMIASNLGVMDLSAAALLMEHQIPILVFDILEQDSLKRAVLEQNIGTLVTGA